MSNFFNLFLSGEGSEGAAPEQNIPPAEVPSQGMQANADFNPQLSKEELRKRRLGSSALHDGASSPQPQSTPDRQGKEKTGLRGNSTSPPLGSSADMEISVPEFEAPFPNAQGLPTAIRMQQSPLTVVTSTTPTAGSSLAAASENATRAPMSPSVDDRPKSATAPVSASTPARHARALHSALEAVFLFTNGTEATPTPSSTSGSSHPSVFLSSNSLTDQLCSKLSKDGVGSTVNYLIGSYKRILARENSIQTDIRAEFMSCKGQCISFLATALQNPDMFGSNSEHSFSDLLRTLGEDASPSITLLVRDLTEELSNQDALGDAVAALLKLCYDQLNAAYDTAFQRNPLQMMMNQMGPAMHSVMGDVSLPLGALCTLSREKRIARLMSQSPLFQLDEALRTAPAPSAGVFGFARAAAAGGVVKGAALAEKTLLGRILRNVVDQRDPQFASLFENAHRGAVKSVVEGNINLVRTRQSSLVNGVHEIIKAMLVSGSPGKENALSWIIQAVALNAELEKDQPSFSVGASRGFMLNMLRVLLQLARPFALDEAKLKKIEMQYLFDPECAGFMPREATKVIELPASTASPVAVTTTPANFMTQTFFLTVRAIHLSFAPYCREYERLLQYLNRIHEEVENGEPRALHLFNQRLGMQCELLQTDLLTDLVNFGTAVSSVLMSALADGVSGGADTSASILNQDRLTEQQTRIMCVVPEYVLADLMTVLIFVAKTRADLLNIPQMSHVLELTLFFLRRPSAVRSPHVRAMFGELLYQIFMPNKEREGAYGWDGRYSQMRYPDGISSRLIEASATAQQHLAPTLLLLYGDVERTGFYEKINHRRRISALLKYLWILPAHRQAFRGIATSEQPVASLAHAGSGEEAEGFHGETSFFIRFANGLLNETNKLVSDMLTSLEAVKTYQVLITTQEWAQMSAEQRKQADEKQEEAENMAKQSAGLCLETMHMVNYLTSDVVIQKPFLQKEILPRFVSMIFNVIYNMSGAKSLSFKVENMESYNFRPKEMLGEVCQALSHVCSSVEFQQAAVGDGFFLDGAPLSKAIKVITKHSLLSASNIALIGEFKDRITLLAVDAADFEELLQDAPEHFLDPLMATVMQDPVLLKTSNTIVDRATIMTQLLNDPIDPFNRAHLTVADLVPCPDLKKEIGDWIAAKKLARLGAAKTAAAGSAGVSGGLEN